MGISLAVRFLVVAIDTVPHRKCRCLAAVCSVGRELVMTFQRLKIMNAEKQKQKAKKYDSRDRTDKVPLCRRSRSLMFAHYATPGLVSQNLHRAVKRSMLVRLYARLALRVIRVLCIAGIFLDLRLTQSYPPPPPPPPRRHAHTDHTCELGRRRGPRGAIPVALRQPVPPLLRGTHG